MSVSLETRITGALNNILGIYGVPEELRKAKIDWVLAKDYRQISHRVLTAFKAFVNDSNEHALAELLEQARHK